MITREQKAQQIKALSERFGKAKAAFIADFQGLTVEQATSLRKKLYSVDAEMKVVRNTLAKLALKDHPEALTAIGSKFTGTNAVIFAYDDVSASAKALTEFSKDFERFKLKSGVMEGKELSAASITALATLPSKDVLRGMLLGTFLAPASSFVRVLNAVPTSVLNVLNAYKDQKGE